MPGLTHARKPDGRVQRTCREGATARRGITRVKKKVDRQTPQDDRGGEVGNKNNEREVHGHYLLKITRHKRTRLDLILPRPGIVNDEIEDCTLEAVRATCTADVS